MYFKCNPRDLDIVEEIVKGQSGTAIAKAHGMSNSNVYIIVRKFARRYLERAYYDGSVEHFYPGRDDGNNGKSIYNWYPFDYSVDFTARHEYHHRAAEKGLPLVDPAQARGGPAVIDIDEMQQYASWWLHQIELIRNYRRPLVKEFDNGISNTRA